MKNENSNIIGTVPPDHSRAGKTKKQLMDELLELRQQIAKIEALETEHKRAEEALRDLTKQWEMTFDAIKDSVFLLDNDGKILKCNESGKGLIGKPYEEIIGKYCWKLMHGTLSPIEGCPIVRMKKTLKRESMLLPVGDKWFEVVVDPIFDSTKKLMSAVHIISDITERKLAEEALRKSEEQYRNLFENTHDMIQSVAPDARFILVNRAWLKTLGYTEVDLPDLNLFKIIHPESLSHCHKMFSKVKAGESIENIQATFVAKDGRSILVEGNATGYYIDDKMVATQGIYRDITERKRAEEEARKMHQGLVEAHEQLQRAYEEEKQLRDKLIQSEKLASLVQMGAKIAHEINNPLTVISGRAQIGRMKDIDEELKKTFALIVLESMRIKNITSTYMNLSKPAPSKR